MKIAILTAAALAVSSPAGAQTLYCPSISGMRCIAASDQSIGYAYAGMVPPQPKTNFDAAWLACVDQGTFSFGSDGTQYSGPTSLKDLCLKVNDLRKVRDAAEQKAEEMKRQAEAKKRAEASLPIIQRGLSDPDGKPPK